MERYDNNYEALVPRSSTTMTSGIAPPCFGYDVITHPFPQSFIVRGIE